MGKQWQTIFSGSNITANGAWSPEIKRYLLLGRKAMINLKSILKSRDIYLPTKICPVKAMVFPVVMYACEIWTNWVAKNWCFWTVVLETTVENHLDCKEIQPVHPKGNWSLNIHWKDWCWSWSSNTLPTCYKELSHWKRPWSWERWKAGGEGMTEEEMVGWHHRLDGHEFKQAPGVGDGQGGLVCCSP